MLTVNKNLKDTIDDLGIIIKDMSISISYTKTNKLITALYMVTDIIDKEEPLRIKLRTLGIEIISDIHSTTASACGKISEIMSFLDIASTIKIISEMNCNILRKEFLELNQSIKESIDKVEILNKQINLSEFFKESINSSELLRVKRELSTKGQYQSMGHSKSINGQQARTRIGVQKGSTLMKALSGVNMSDIKLSHIRVDSFNILKKQRREDIINFLRKKEGGATITDIKNGAQGVLISCSEKTIQRELVSMVKDSVLDKTGEKRWSRYFIKFLSN